jgi:hypothetical protein
MRKKKDTYTLPVYTKNNVDSTTHKSRNKHSILHYHENKIDEFKNNKKKKQLIDEIKKLKNFQNNTNDIKNKLCKLESDLNKLNEEESSYLLKTSTIIFKYLELDDMEKEYINNNENDTKLLTIHNQKITLTHEYMQMLDPNYIIPIGTCDYNVSKDDVICKNCNIYLNVDNGYYVCNECGYSVSGFEESLEPSYKELQEYMYKPQFTYQKETHLDDHLRRLQAKENKIISQEILDKIILEANKQKITNLNMLTESMVKKFLKKLNLNEYYDNVITIINKLNARPPVILTTEIENKIKIMFRQIQEPFNRHKPSIRKNFLSYSYILFQFFKILGLQEFTEYFPLLKSADKLRQQDEIFKKIVQDMAKIDKSVNWVFYPTI